jgi:proline iminopeptidase/L-proline amide hydrolase
MAITRRDVLTGVGAVAVGGVTATRAFAEAGVPPADRELQVPVKGGSLYVRVNGDLRSGKPPLLMVHGGPGGALWQFFPALPLASDRAVVLYDQLDSGRSEAPGNPANWTVDRFADEIEGVRAALGLERFHLLGHSWGGIVANRYASRRPPALRSLILQGTPLSAARAEASVHELFAQLPDGAGAVIEQHQQAGTFNDPAYGKAMGVFMRKHLARTSVKSVALPYMTPTPEDRGDALANAMTGGQIGRFRGVLQGFDVEALLPRIAVPTLLLGAEFDLMTAQAQKAVLPRLRQGSYVEIAGAGHMTQFDQPDAWRAAVAAFIAQHDA